MKATFIKTVRSMVGDGRLFQLSPPMRSEGRDPIEFVVVSAVDIAYSGPETYIFEADEYGTIVNFAELRGSFRGALDHQRALAIAGYEE